METLDLEESAFHRAQSGFTKAFHTFRFWAVLLSIGVSLGIWARLWQPGWADESPAIEIYQGLIPVGGIAAGLVLLMLGCLFLSPYQQRNEARRFIDAHSGLTISSARSDIAMHIMFLQTQLPVLSQIGTQKRMNEYRHHVQRDLENMYKFIRENLPQYATPTLVQAVADGCDEAGAVRWTRKFGQVVK